MTERRIRISMPGNSRPSEIQSSATTWGVLQGELEAQLGISFDNTKVRDFTTKHHYDDSGAVLPESEVKLIVSTDKNKSGMAINKENYHKATYTDLRTFCKKITGFGPNGKGLCLKALDEHYGTEHSSPASKKAEVKKTVSKTVTAKVKTTKPSSDLEARVTKLEGVIFGETEEDAAYLAATRANS